jgi:RND superfamily putative drug exporter
MIPDVHTVKASLQSQFFYDRRKLAVNVILCPNRSQLGPITTDQEAPMTALLDRIARSASRHWRRSLATAAVIMVALGALAGTLGGEFTDEFSVPGTESQQALDLLEDRFPAAANEGATVVFYTDEGTVGDGDRPQAIADARQAIAELPHVTSVSNPLSKRGNQVSDHGRVAFATVQYDRPAFEVEQSDAQQLDTAARVAEGGGLEVAMRGPVVDVAEEQLAPVGELIGIAVAVIALTLVFGSLAAMLLTLISALIALGGGMMLLTLGAGATSVPEVAPTLAVMLGLGAGIDYALLIVGRYREHLAAGESVPDSAAAASRTAGVSVLAAGAIVTVAIAGLLTTGIPFVGRMGVATAVVVASVAIGAVTLLPALMGAFARRLRPKEEERLGQPILARWDERITRRPWVALAAGVAVLLALAAPFTDLRLGQPDDGNDRQDSTTRIAYDKLAEGFGPGFNGTLQLASSLPSGRDSAPTLERLRDEVERTDGVAAVSEPTPSPQGDAATMTVTPTTAPQDERTSDLVSTLREDVVPVATAGSGVEVYVGGNTATEEDMADKIAERLPAFIGAVVILSVLFLMAVFRSVWVPLVSAAFNLLSIAAAYGVVVAIFQWQWGSSLLGIDGEVPIVSFIPLFMFAILFGLSMDYNVFLLSRIREEYLKGAGPRESVVNGMARVSRLVLAAGAIMTAVFLGFATDPDVIVKIFGIGLGVAIMIDVLIVRMVVAPAVMTLLGDRAWWFPAWLDRLLPQLELDGDERPEGEPREPERDRRRAPLPSNQPAAADAHEG